MRFGNDLANSYQFFGNAPNDIASEIPLGLSTPEAPSRKSPFLAAALSLVLPGLGEYYVGDQIWRGAIFTVLEAGLWYGNMTYESRGDDSTIRFQEFANDHWSTERYSNYLNSLLEKRDVSTRITDPNNIAQINNAEDTLSSLNFEFFTHRLPPRGHQQYYELISKYHQYTRGWDDATGDMLDTAPNSGRHSEMRANMNEQYTVAETFLYGIFLNHALSAIDAVLLAHDHNSQIRIEGSLERKRDIDGTMGYRSRATVTFRL